MKLSDFGIDEEKRKESIIEMIHESWGDLSPGKEYLSKLYDSYIEKTEEWIKLLAETSPVISEDILNDD